MGVRLLSSQDLDQDGKHQGIASTTIHKLTPANGRWYRFRIRGLAQDNFQVERDELFMEAEFFRDGGTNSLDHIRQTIYPQVERGRADLADKGTNRSLGNATWRSFDMVFRTPYPEVDTIRLNVGFGNGKGTGERSEFWISEWETSADSGPCRICLTPTTGDGSRSIGVAETGAARWALVLRSARWRSHTSR